MLLSLWLRTALSNVASTEIRPDPVFKTSADETEKQSSLNDEREAIIESSMIPGSDRENKVLDIFNARVLSTQFNTVVVTSFA